MQIALSCGRSRCSYVSEIDPATGCITVTWPDVTFLTHVMLCARGKTGEEFDFLKSVEQTSINQVIFCHSKGKRKKDRRKEKTDFLSGEGEGPGGGGGGGSSLSSIDNSRHLPLDRLTYLLMPIAPGGA